MTGNAVTNRSPYIDRAKAVAMLCIVFGHVGLYSYNGFKDDIDYCRVTHFTNMFQLTLFMYLSGLVVSVRPKCVKDALIQIYRKFRQLIVPCIVFGVSSQF